MESVIDVIFQSFFQYLQFGWPVWNSRLTPDISEVPQNRHSVSPDNHIVSYLFWWMETVLNCKKVPRYSNHGCKPVASRLSKSIPVTNICPSSYVLSNALNLSVPGVHWKVIHALTKLQVSVAGLFKYVQPFSGNQALKD